MCGFTNAGNFPFFVAEDGPLLPGRIMISFAQHLHVRLGLLASTTLTHLVSVSRAHTERGLVSPCRGPDFKLVKSRLDAASKISPHRAFIIGPCLLRRMHLRPGRGRLLRRDEVCFQISVVSFFVAGRPIEILGPSRSDLSSRRMSWERIVWCTIAGGVCAPDGPVYFALIHLFRKGDPFCGHRVPLFASGDSNICGLRCLIDRWFQRGQPHQGPVFDRFDDDTIIRQRHLSEYLTAQALRQRHPRMVPYGLRRACLTIMAAAGVDEDDRLDFAGHTRDNGKLSSHSRYIDPDPSRFRHVAQLLTETELQCIARR